MSVRTTFRVCDSFCSQCLFTSNKVVSDERKAEILEECLRKNRWFICHKTEDTCCYGFWVNHNLDIWPLRLAQMLDGITVLFVSPESE